MKRTLLIDGDILVYRWAFGAETAIDWGDGIWTLHADATEAAAMLDNNVAKLMTLLDADSVVFTLTGTKNYRKQLWPSYKANRKEQRKPLCMPALREHIAATYAVSQSDGLEADDILGIMGTAPNKGDVTRIIVSDDKDLLQIPGWHYRPCKSDDGVFAVSPEEGERLHYLQTLAGDPTDNYPGCPGVGLKVARRILDAAGDKPWAAIRKTYETAGLTEQDALTQARVAKILTYDLYDRQKRKPILWTPSK